MACRPVGAKPSSDICNLWYNNGWSPHTRAAKTSNRILHKKIAVFLLYRAIASLCLVLDLYSQSLQPMDMNYIYVMDAAISSIGSASQQTTSLDTEKCKNYVICNVYDFFVSLEKWNTWSWNWTVGGGPLDWLKYAETGEWEVGDSDFRLSFHQLMLRCHTEYRSTR